MTKMGFLSAPVELEGDALVGDVRDGKFFYKDDAFNKLTGTIPEVTIVSGSQAIPAGIHTAENLVEIDADFVAAKIAKDEVMFGEIGTFESALIEDILGSATRTMETYTSGTYYRKTLAIGAGADITLATKTQDYNASSLAVGVAVLYATSTSAEVKVQLIMDGVMVSENFVAIVISLRLIMGTRALSGSKTCLCRLYNYHGSSQNIYFYQGDSGDMFSQAGIAIGSVKI